MNTKPLFLALLLVVCQPSTLRRARADEPIQVRLYGSVTTGVSNKRARVATRPMIDLILERAGYKGKANLDVEKADNPGDLMAFGKRLDEGQMHLGVVWGIEYGWLRQSFPELKPLAV